MGSPGRSLIALDRIEIIESTVERFGTVDEVPGATHTPNLMTVRSRWISGQMGEI